jgi:hypothetical protein
MLSSVSSCLAGVLVAHDSVATGPRPDLIDPLPQLPLRSSARARTYGANDEHDEERVQHRHHRRRQRGDNVPQRAHPAEEPEDPKGPYRPAGPMPHTRGGLRSRRG